MKTIRILSAVALLAASAAASAANFSYDYLEGGFGELDNDGDVIQFGGSKGMDKAWGVLGSIGFADFGGNADGTVLQGGGFMHSAINTDADFYANIRLVYAEWDAPAGFDDNDIGFAAAGGIRYQIQDNFHVEGELSTYQLDPFDDGLGLKIAARYFFDKQISVAGGVASKGDYDGIFVGVRYDLK